MSDLSPTFHAGSSMSGTEALFQLPEMFYSRTDERGVIKAGNMVFRRVAGYDWPDLLGAPHKIIRHPDTPKAVFHLLWENIKAGRATGAYVKNQRKGGRAYWVFALVAPVDGGYVSTRIKPSSKLFGEIEELYADILAREKSEGLTSEQSAEALTRAVQAMGYANYDSFQSHALASEFEARARQLGRPIGQLQRRFMDMSKAITQVESETTELTEAIKSIRTVPMNMRIIASRLENAGGPISAISVNYSQMLEEMSTWVTTFVDGDACVFARIRDSILRGQFLSFASGLETEMTEHFRATDQEYPSNVIPEDEIAQLSALQQEFSEAMTAVLQKVETEAKRFARSVLDMKRYVTGLSSTRMMCKIESAALSNSGTALAGIVDQLDECQEEIEQRLAKLVELNSVVQGNTSMLRTLV
ncbi:PAS domain-containing protein [Tropicibacter naphthalenivorans]|uniref:Aerotaxis receptor n=1 Tax=Tropicibacter naphthalenivorans TaxID=441103 RepID=A0A0P1GU36_9RHOB|nr:PAS domain-containing protein [Tropicibacter naphthalenivorans]CUH78067.1 Aerotaxis receptor [Tropicibacter naphthalenivorans]SMC93940.1 aerotaxis receptor [Tropicibacter naphthalenivorans]